VEQNGASGSASDPAPAPVVLDLYYLLTAFGKQEFAPEILLAYAIQKLNEQATLSRTTIRQATGRLTKSDLANFVDPITVNLYKKKVDDVPNLWLGLRTDFRPSAIYKVSMVVIENTTPAYVPSPVLERSLIVESTLERAITEPMLFEATGPSLLPVVRMGEPLTLRGYNLGGDDASIRFVYERNPDEPLDLPADSVTATELTVTLPTDPPPRPVSADSADNPDNWLAGMYTVSAAITTDNPKSMRTTGVLPIPIVLAPRIVNPTADRANDGTITLSIGCSPKVHKAQHVSLVLGTTELAAEPIKGETTSELVVKTSSMPQGPQRIRLRVDDAESIFVNRKTTPPTYLDSERVNIP
ncbi:MAG: Pvc16 family protein, partial [Halobacteriota archaeon]